MITAIDLFAGPNGRPTGARNSGVNAICTLNHERKGAPFPTKINPRII